MDIIFSLGLFVFAYFVSLLFTISFLVPIFYAVPKAFVGFVKKELKFRAVLAYTVAPIVWTAALLLFAFLLASFSPDIFLYISNNTGFVIGDALGAVTALLNLIFSKKTHMDAKSDFDEFIKPYKLSNNI